MKLIALGLALAVIASAGCSSSPSEPLGRYDLACDTMDVEGMSQFVCARIDTRKGAVSIVNIEAIDKTDGLGFQHLAPVGRYQVRCNSTDVREAATFRCLRLDTASGKVQRVELVEAASTLTL